MPPAPDAVPQLGTRRDVNVPGLYVERDENGAVDQILFAGRVRDAQMFGGPLPHGLSWTMTATEALASIGREAGKDCCRFYDLGLELHFTARCLAAVQTFEPVPRGTVRVRSLRVTASGTETRGIALAAHVDGPREDRGVEFALVDGDDRELIRTTEQFVPFVDLPLPPGPHVLTAIVHGTTATTTGDRTHTFEIEMPKKWRVRVGVREIRMQALGDEDGFTRTIRLGTATAIERERTFAPAKFERSDPRWRLVYNRRFVHTSTTRKNAIRARWKRRAPWLVVAEGDVVRIEVEDVDLVFHDKLGSFSFAVEDLVAGKKLEAKLGSTEVRLMKTRVRTLQP